jgi:hypothetical protein
MASLEDPTQEDNSEMHQRPDRKEKRDLLLGSPNGKGFAWRDCPFTDHIL